MVWKIPTANSNADVVLGTDSMLVAKGILVGAINGTGSNQKVIVDGTSAGDNFGVTIGGGLNFINASVVVHASGAVYGMGITGVALRSDNASLLNDGYIYGGSYGVVMSLYGTGTSTVTNAGTIESDGIALHRYSSANALVIVNSGTIKGTTYAYSQSEEAGGVGKDDFTNTGKIIGIVDLGGDDDRFDSRIGSVKGDIRGGAGADTIYTGAGNQKLFGNDGRDSFSGGSGADTFDGGADADKVTYFDSAKGIVANFTTPSLNTGDAKGDKYISIENLNGSKFDDTLTGDSKANVVFGSDGSDVINGMGGKDTLTGGAGKDFFVFNTALGSGNVDTITSYSVASDTIRLENKIFVGLSAGELASPAFHTNETGKAADDTDRIIYEKDTGNLYFDRDGNKANYDSVLFAHLDDHLSLTYKDFFII